ncbi:hypothetical protein FRC03_010941 [Tulasnella sp. 419]|nr:hypothetical protein FRC03_010941 [Tulasnella sp. 419]
MASAGSSNRKEHRPCDACRKKKIKCDSQIKDGRCSYCTGRGISCTFVEKPPQRHVPKGYIDDLEARMKALESLSSKIGIDYEKELGPSFSSETWDRDSPTVRPPFNEDIKGHSTGRARPTGRLSTVLHLSATPKLPSISQTPESSDVLDSSGDEGHYPSPRCMSPTRDSVSSVGTVFYGKSSDAPMVAKAHRMKQEAEQASVYEGPSAHIKREEYWVDQPWELAAESHGPEDRWVATHLEFPPPDLARSLIDLYFRYVAPIYPLLHRPTFEAQISAGEHLKDRRTAMIYLLVCANASRWSRDPRVCTSIETENDADFTTGGYHYFWQVMSPDRRHFSLRAPKLPDIQIVTLGSLYLQGSPTPNIAWVTAGIGIRLAVQLALHRRRAYINYGELEGQMMKRAFWCLVLLERQIACTLGRPCAIQDEDMDVDFPADLDDDYWVQGSRDSCDTAQPCKMSFFTPFAKLHQLLAFVLRTIYSIRKSRIHLGFVGPDWEQRIVSEIDSALNGWIDTVPDHLKWSPEIQDQTFFMQSAHLQLMFYDLQLLVHRPFLPESPRGPSALADASMIVCTHAARAMGNILHAYHRKHCPSTRTTYIWAFNAGIALMISIWRTRKAGDPVERTNMDAFHQCVYALKEAESHWVSAGRLCDVLASLAAAGDLPFLSPETIDEKSGIITQEIRTTPSVPTNKGQREKAVSANDFALPHLGTGDQNEASNRNNFGSNAWNYYLGGGSMNLTAGAPEPTISNAESKCSSIFQDGVVNDSWLNDILGIPPLVNNGGSEIGALSNSDPANWDLLPLDGAGIFDGLGGMSDAERQWQSFVLNQYDKAS